MADSDRRTKGLYKNFLHSFLLLLFIFLSIILSSMARCCLGKGGVAMAKLYCAVSLAMLHMYSWKDLERRGGMSD